MNLASWILGLLLIVLTIATHTTAVVMLAFGHEKRIPTRVDMHNIRPARAIPMMIGRIGALALLLTVLHGMECVFWAAAYWWLGALDSFTDASVYSLGTMTTFEIPGLALPSRWQVLSALEAVNGVLLFGISTAFIFAVMQTLWPLVSQRQTPT